MEKIKHFLASDKGKDVLIIAIIILVGLSSFGLGRLSVAGQGSSLRVTYPDQSANAISALTYDKLPKETQELISTKSNVNTPTDSSKSFFASSRGSKYYPVHCTAGKSIKIENRVYFTSEADAQRAGYSLSTSCK